MSCSCSCWDSQRCPFREYFKLRLNLWSSLLTLSACCRSDPPGSEDQASSRKVRAGTDLCAFPRGSCPRCCVWGLGCPPEVRLGASWCPACHRTPTPPPGPCSQRCDPEGSHSAVLSHRAQTSEARAPTGDPPSLGEVGRPDPFDQTPTFPRRQPHHLFLSRDSQGQAQGSRMD